MMLMGAIALAGIIVLLYSEFRAWRLVILVMLSFVFALIGGVLGVWFGGGSLSLGSLVGFVTVVGIAVRNGIMMISHFRHLEIEEGMEFGRPLAIRGAEERLAPILMTALTAALALLPLVIAGNKPGHEIEYPMALVIVGGLLIVHADESVHHSLLVLRLWAGDSPGHPGGSLVGQRSLASVV